MLPKKFRLHYKKDIQKLFAKGKIVFGFTMNIKYNTNQLQVSRFVVVVGTKVSKSAVVRNRLRRQIRAIIFKQLSKFKPGFDLMFMLKKEAVGKKSQDFEAEILRILRQKTRLLI